jgi:hypothetical protein
MRDGSVISEVMKQSILLFGFVAAVLMWRFDVAFSAPSGGYRTFDLSLPEFTLNAGEQISEFTCQVFSGSIVQVSIPFQWNVSVDSSIGGRATLTAFSVTGSDAFYQQDLALFTMVS